MRIASKVILALTASLALGAMTVAADAGHKGNNGNGGNAGGAGMDHHHDHGHWKGGVWIPYVGVDDGPHCWWQHGYKHCRYD